MKKFGTSNQKQNGNNVNTGSSQTIDNTIKKSGISDLVRKFEQKTENNQKSNSRSVTPENHRNSITNIIEKFEKNIKENEKKKKFEEEFFNRIESEILLQHAVSTPIMQNPREEEDSKVLDSPKSSGSPPKMFKEFSNPYKVEFNVLNQQQKPRNEENVFTQNFGNIELCTETVNLAEEIRPTANFGDIPNNKHLIEENEYSKVLEEGSGEDDSALNVSTFKPVMNNPLPVNKSILDASLNQSDLNISRTKDPKILLQEKEKIKNQQTEHDNLGNAGLQLNLINFEANLLSQRTEDTRDLSHMSIPTFKNQFYQRDNSFYLNMSKLNQSNISQNKSFNKSFNAGK